MPTTLIQKPSESQRLATARAFAIEAARLMSQTRCHQVAVLDVSGISPITDYLVLANGTSGRQMHGVADDVIEMGQEKDFDAIRSSGMEGDQWVVVDFMDVVVHLFNPETRLYYDLDGLWGDARPVAWTQNP